jgi:Peptidase family S41
MKNILLLLICFFYISKANAQADCNCTQNFKVLQQKVKNNYGGYESRITPKNKVAFEQLTDSVTKAAAILTDGYDCYTLMNRWVAFFKDGHLYLTTTFPSKSMSIGGPKLTTLDSTVFYQYLDKNKDKLEAAEGVWRTDDGNYTVAVKRDETLVNAYQATILKAKSEKWKVGLEKFALKKEGEKWKATYYMGDFTPTNIIATLNENILIFTQFGMWQKVYPEPKIKLDADQIAMDQIAYFKMIDDKTAYLRFSTFNEGPDVIDSVINKNKAQILSTPRLIIDIRDNGGGSNSNYKNILPFMYTQPYTVEGEGGYMVASEENIIVERKIYEQAWNSLSEENKKEYAKDYAEWKSSIDSTAKFIGARYYYPATPPTKMDSITTYPKQVAVLINKGCASTAEWFIMEAEYSKKVTLFGQNSAGIMDNTNVRQHTLACPSYTVGAASGRRGGADKRPIDNIGFKPNVYIPETEEDWVKVVLEYWEKQ